MQYGNPEDRRPDVVYNRGCEPADRPHHNQNRAAERRRRKCRHNIAAPRLRYVFLAEPRACTRGFRQCRRYAARKLHPIFASCCRCGGGRRPDAIRYMLPLRRGSATPAPYQPLHLGEVAIFIARVLVTRGSPTAHKPTSERLNNATSKFDPTRADRAMVTATTGDKHPLLISCLSLRNEIAAQYYGAGVADPRRSDNTG